MSTAQRQLVAAVAAANRAGFAIRVAVIANDYDLGSVTELWHQPRTYARFLGVELSLAHRRQRLLVVMPNGFGFNWPGHATAPTYRLLATVPLGSSAGAGLAAAAEVAVRRLASRLGSCASVEPARGGWRSGAVGQRWDSDDCRRRGWRDRCTICVRGRRHAIAASACPAAGTTGAGAAAWAIPGLVVLCGVAVAAPIVAWATLDSSSAPTAYSAVSLVSPPASSWGAGDRRAPNFSLRDQDGRPVSLAANRGHPVIVTFVDPLCRNFCPLEAQVLNQMVTPDPGRSPSGDHRSQRRRIRERAAVPSPRRSGVASGPTVALGRRPSCGPRCRVEELPNRRQGDDVADQWHRYVSHRPHRGGVCARRDRTRTGVVQMAVQPAGRRAGASSAGLRTEGSSDMAGGAGFPAHSSRRPADPPPGRRRRWRGSPSAVTLEPHSEIVLEVGPYVPPHRSYTFPPRRCTIIDIAGYRQSSDNLGPRRTHFA